MAEDLFGSTFRPAGWGPVPSLYLYQDRLVIEGQAMPSLFDLPNASNGDFMQFRIRPIENHIVEGGER